MNTLKTALVSRLASAARQRHPAVAWFTAQWERLGRSDEERFLTDATDPEDLEQRLRLLERDGLPPDRSATM